MGTTISQEVRDDAAIAGEGLDALFSPRGVIVVGASRTPGKLGTAMTDALASGATPLTLVNSKGGDGMEGDVRGAADALGAQGAYPDLLISCVPASATAGVIEQAGIAGVRAALVCAGGFAEAGEAGVEHQRALEAAVRRSGVRLLGPNTSGFFVPGRGLRASFVPGAASLAAGSVAVIASSGGVNHVLGFRLARAGVGVSLGVGIGAGIDVTHADVVRYAASDESTTAIALHVESIADGAALLDAVRRAAARKPVVAYVVGRRAESAFAQSHTGALATSWRTTRSLLAQAGAVVVDDEDQLVAAVTALSRVRLAPSSDPGVALITAQAGPGLIIDDHAVADDWNLPRLADATRATVATMLPPLTFQDNPVDTGRPGPQFPGIIRAVSVDPGIDLIAIYALTEPVVDLPDAVRAAAPATPVLLCVDGPGEETDVTAASARETGFALLTGPSSLASAISAVIADARARGLAADPVPPRAPAAGIDAAGPWDEVRAKELLDGRGIATPSRRRVRDAAGARAALQGLGGPVAVKMVDAAVLHKTELGGVRLGITGPKQMDAAIDEITAATGATEFLVEQMAPSGVDLVVSVRRDPVFGPIGLVGLGGTAAEAIADVAIRAVPCGQPVVESMLEELQGSALLHGWRGGPRIDPAELTRVVSALAGVLETSPAVFEIEINPLRLTPAGLVALDAVVTTA